MERGRTPKDQAIDTQAARRAARLKAALKANMARRKAQARARAGSERADGSKEPQQDD